jgi:hypothetical protein
MGQPSSLDENSVAPSPSVFDMSNLLGDLGRFDGKYSVNSSPDVVTTFDVIIPFLPPVTGVSSEASS